MRYSLVLEWVWNLGWHHFLNLAVLVMHALDSKRQNLVMERMNQRMNTVEVQSFP